MRRILAIAYSLVWAWTEHRVASDMMQREPAEQIVVLFDEVEAHLHPKWQRSIIPALLSAVKVLEESLDVQVISATHSPLVMASVEPEFDESSDEVFHLELEKSRVTIDRVPWAKQGDVTGWLVSEIFGLDQARSQEAERAIEAAEAFMRDDTDQLPADLDSEDTIDRELRRVLPDHDPFWPRWITQTKRAS
jgi:hypothetical protein